MRIKHLTSALAMCLAFAACKSNSTSTNTTTGGGTVPTSANTITYTADGTSYTAIGAGSKTSSSGQNVIAVAGGDATGHGIGWGVSNISATGTYDVGKILTISATPQIITMYYSYISGNDTVQYSSPYTGTTSVGTMNITELTSTSFKGTFDVTLSKTKGTSGASTVHLVGGGNVTVM